MSGSSRTIGNLLGGKCDPCADADKALDRALNVEDTASSKSCYTEIGNYRKHSMEDNAASHSKISSTSAESSEPFSTYQHKVQKLCLQLGLTVNHLEELDGGGYNRVIAIDCDLPKDSPSQARYVLRVPNSPTECNSEFPESASLMNQVAMLNFLSTRTRLRIANLVSFDASYLNPLGSEYMLQTRLSGVALNTVYKNMTLMQKLDITYQIAATLVAMEGIVFPAIGDLIALSQPPEPWNAPGVAVPGPSPLRVVEVDTKPPSHWNKRTPLPPPTTLEGFFDRQFTRRVAEDGESYSNLFGEELWSWGKLLAISKEMAKMGWLNSDLSAGGILHHWDLEARNIMVEYQEQSSPSPEPPPTTTSGRWKITGIIDWDEALSDAPILAHKPPMWLWNDIEAFSLYFTWIGCDDDVVETKRIFDQWDYDIDTAPPLALNEDESLIKRTFDAEMEYHVPGYCRHAYEHGKMVRRLAAFSKMNGMSDWEQFRYERFLEEWENERTMWQERHGVEITNPPPSMPSPVEHLDPTMPQYRSNT